MKKIYLKPEMECSQLNAVWALCGASTESGGGTDPTPMPQRPAPTF